MLVWLIRLRKTNGPNFTWPMIMFCSALPEKLLGKMGKLYTGKPLEIKTRAELLASIKPNYWKHLRKDTGDVPESIDGFNVRTARSSAQPPAILQTRH